MPPSFEGVPPEPLLFLSPFFFVVFQVFGRMGDSFALFLRFGWGVGRIAPAFADN
jgi:hypothetical protein